MANGTTALISVTRLHSGSTPLSQSTTGLAYLEAGDGLSLVHTGTGQNNFDPANKNSCLDGVKTDLTPNQSFKDETQKAFVQES